MLLAPVEVKLSDLTVLQPDLPVARREAFTEIDLPAAPLLAVEVLSPSTRHIDARPRAAVPGADRAAGAARPLSL